MNIADIIEKCGRCHPDDTAFIEVKPVSGARDQITWARFDERTNRGT